MVFERTPNGQQNRRLFLRVDVTLYVEGGDQTQGNSESYDITYWTRMFGVFKPNVRVRCLPKGRKSTLLELHNGIVENNIKNVFVAVDSDYDFQSGSNINDSRLLYTYGYSWENDIWENENGINIFYNMCPVDPVTVNISNDFASELTRFILRIKRVLKSDLACVQSGVSIIPRNAPESLFRTMNFGDVPDLNIVRLRVCIQAAKTERKSKGISVKGTQVTALEVPRYCVGKLLHAFMYKLITYLMRKNGLKLSISKQVMCSAAILSLCLNLNDDATSEIYAHHWGQFSKLPIKTS